jgi:hypothetical protein
MWLCQSYRLGTETNTTKERDMGRGTGDRAGSRGYIQVGGNKKLEFELRHDGKLFKAFGKGNATM